MYEMGTVVAESSEVSRAARPSLDRLALETEVGAVGRDRRGSVLYLARGDAPSGFHMVAAPVRRSPLHATASGKLLLAFEDPDEAASYLGGTLGSFTPNAHRRKGIRVTT